MHGNKASMWNRHKMHPSLGYMDMYFEESYNVDEVVGLFAGGSLPQEDKEAYMAAISKAYFESNEINKKYTPKKHRK